MQYSPTSTSTSSTSHSRLSIPADAWDSHVHVIDPVNFPLSPDATYKAHAALLPDLIKSAKRLQVPNLVFVQVSTYGHDNSCQLAALKSLGGLSRGRVVVEFDPATIEEATLRDWHAQGVRGVRINLKSVGKELSGAELASLVRSYAAAIKPLGSWVIDLHVPLASIPHLEPLLPELSDQNTHLVIDHMGSPPGLRRDMSTFPGWSSLLTLLRRHENFHVKISAPYRFVRDRSFGSLEHVVRPLLEARQGSGVLWASDWPHTRFEGTDVGPWGERCLEWCDGDQGVVDLLFRGNAREVWGVKE